MTVKIADDPGGLLMNHNAAAGISSFQISDMKWTLGAAVLIKHPGR